MSYRGNEPIDRDIVNIVTAREKGCELLTFSYETLADFEVGSDGCVDEDFLLDGFPPLWKRRRDDPNVANARECNVILHDEFVSSRKRQELPTVNCIWRLLDDARLFVSVVYQASLCSVHLLDTGSFKIFIRKHRASAHRNC